MKLFLFTVFQASVALLLSAATGRTEPSESFFPPLSAQAWVRDVSGPTLSLGAPGDFDDRHLFAPCLIRWNGEYWMYYCGSRGEVQDRVFRLGLARSRDGKSFEKDPRSPVFEFEGGRRSVLTPTILTDLAGDPILFEGKMRMWFSSTDFHDPTGRHTLHLSESADGIEWSTPTTPLLDHVYAPTMLFEEGRFKMWWSDVSADPWVIRYSESEDGLDWKTENEVCLAVDQGWEKNRLFYPHVRPWKGGYGMWYGAYWTDRPNTTAIGFAVSEDGVRWTKSQDNPVLRPDPTRPWESHYTTSQSVLRMPDGGWRIWYATRKEPPFVNKYFAVGTAKMVKPMD